MQTSGYKLGEEVIFALDWAANQIFSDDGYYLNGKKNTSEEIISHLAELQNTFPISSIEDALDENDWDGWINLTNVLGEQTQLVGDDLFVTNKLFLEKGIDLKAGNSILIKINQIGTLTETIETIKLAKENNYKCVISHRSGETEDSFIADLAVGTGSGQIKTGAPSRSDRNSKYNRLIYIDALENLKFEGTR